MILDHILEHCSNLKFYMFDELILIIIVLKIIEHEIGEFYFCL